MPSGVTGMANIVIVTEQCYLLCEAINFIVINEVSDDEDDSLFETKRSKARNKKVKKPVKPQVDNRRFNIIIDFIPTGGAIPSQQLKKSGSTPGSAHVSIAIVGKDYCIKLFSHMVKQIREQIPDNRFLDSIVEEFLQGDQDEHPA
jgi:hypothetical protein